MTSKLPKPLSLKFPQRTNERAHEAPTNSIYSQKTLHLRRRSKSVTDLSNLVSKPITDLLPHPQSKQTVYGKGAVKRPISKAVPVKPAGAATSGIKRTLTSKTDDGMSKAKITRKIPEWDYKGRFNQLNEKHQVLQESAKELKAKVTGYDQLTLNFKNVLEEVKALKEVQTNLELKCENYDDLKKEYTDLKNIYSELSEDHKTLLENNTILKKEHEHCLKENSALQKALEIGKKEIERLNVIITTQLTELQAFDEERRVLHNKIQDLKGNIRVFCRIRPPLSSEKDKLLCSIDLLDENSLEIRKSRESVSQITGKNQDCKSEFNFDKIFSQESNQEEIFEDLAQLVQSALDGYNVCVFAYGQTGSGKTYTMLGGAGSEEGMIPRTINLIFKIIEKMKWMDMEYSAHASFLEIYNENIRDLLNINNSQKLEIYFNEGKGTIVTNLIKQPISSAVELEMYMRQANNNRATAATDFNQHSSRSHAVTKIYLQGTCKRRNVVYNGSLNLVDLAGSENAKQSVAGDRLTETKNINKSLATLGDVICALQNNSKHIPYRNSKLTYLLQSCLGGSSKTLMIVTIAPFEECFGESISSLRFASKVKEVKTASKRNKVAISQMLKQKSAII